MAKRHFITLVVNPDSVPDFERCSDVYGQYSSTEILSQFETSIIDVTESPPRHLFDHINVL
jgi:hypothetical protein